MAIEKKNRQTKTQKNNRKKALDSFSRKDWYNVKAPDMFANTQVGKTLATRLSGTKDASDSLNGRIFDVSLEDLKQDENQSTRKVRLRIEHVQGRDCLTHFWGMELTCDKIRSIVKKWQTTIEANVNAKTIDGYVLRFSVIALSKKKYNQVKKTSYIKSSHEHQIRKRMVDIVIKEVECCNLIELIQKLIPEIIGKQIEMSCLGLHPLQYCLIRKVKMIKTPKTDITMLLEFYENVFSAVITT
jgi:small subunit ribosomal protein S3Ae